MRDLNDLLYFAAVVDHAGFSAASRALGIPKSKLSRRVAQLEERLSVRLLQRSTRTLALTEVGQRFYEHCKAMLVEADAAETMVAATHAQPCGKLHITCPITLLHMQVGALLVDFAQHYPQVQMHITATNRAVDVLAEGVDIALRVRPLPLQDSELAYRLLGNSVQCLVASSQLIERMGGLPAQPADLSTWPSLGHGGQTSKFVWQLAQGDERIDMAHTPMLTTDDLQTLHAAALAGLGVVQLPRMLVQADIDSGALIDLLPDWQLEPQAIHAVFASRRGMLPAVRALLDTLAAAFEPSPSPML